jgi:methylmalonyl-CoA mutase N-terminal domain/subunit
MNDPSPFTLLAFELAVAKRRGVPWTRITGTSNQSDCISHFVANHMFFRIALQGARRIVVDHIVRQRAGAGLEPAVHRRPAHAAGRRHAGRGDGLHAVLGDPVRRGLHRAGMDPDRFLPRFTFFFDISVSLFEEVAKFRAGRRVWASCAASASAPRTRARGASSSTARPRAWT